MKMLYIVSIGQMWRSNQLTNCVSDDVPFLMSGRYEVQPFRTSLTDVDGEWRLVLNA